MMERQDSGDHTPQSGASVAPVAMPQETLSQKGAMALAQRLERFWHEEGYPAARFWAEPVDERFAKIGTYEIYRVASNLVNGLPPRYMDQ
jgi:hypothetical protein